MFRKLFALEVEAIASYDNPVARDERGESEILAAFRDAFTPRTANYGTMWSARSPR